MNTVNQDVNNYVQRNCDDLNILYTNTDSLSNKFDELKTYIELYKSDIILITETMPKNINYNFSNTFNLLLILIALKIMLVEESVFFIGMILI